MKPLSQLGVTLIELMITLAVLAILVVLALPGYTRWIQNSQIRTASDAILNGLQLARAEAVQRNANVVFAFTSGTGWMVTSSNTVVQSRSAGEGSRNVVRTVAPATATRVTFNGLGRLGTNADASLPIASMVLDVPTTILSAADSRELTILISTSGQVRLCDPDLGLSAGDPRRC